VLKNIIKKASREKEVRKPGRQTGNTVAVQLDAFTKSGCVNQRIERLLRTPHHQ
jgi:hypothetical protein